MAQNASVPPGPPLPLPRVDGNELQAVKAALSADITDAGVGILHLSTNDIHLRPTSQTKPPGHTALVKQLGFNRSDCRGFVIALSQTDDCIVENVSGLNQGTGGASNLQMPQNLFDAVKQALANAGL